MLDRVHRIVRPERMIRVGTDGPEPPRPHDRDPELPVDVRIERDRARGIVYLEDDVARDAGPSPDAV